jgi:hypothetical protein
VSKIAQDEMFGMMLEASPTFAAYWAADAGESLAVNDDGSILHYVVLGDFARHLIEQLKDEETSEFPAVFSVVERCVENGDDYVVNAIIVGLLERLQNDEHSERLFGWLGPRAQKAWRDLDEFWQKVAPS